MMQNGWRGWRGRRTCLKRLGRIYLGFKKRSMRKLPLGRWGGPAKSYRSKVQRRLFASDFLAARRLRLTKVTKWLTESSKLIKRSQSSDIQLFRCGHAPPRGKWQWHVMAVPVTRGFHIWHPGSGCTSEQDSANTLIQCRRWLKPGSSSIKQCPYKMSPIASSHLPSGRLLCTGKQAAPICIGYISPLH